MPSLQVVGFLFVVIGAKVLSVCSSDPDYLFSQIAEFISNSSNYISPKNNDAFFLPEDTSTNPIDFGTYDFIIVGGGTAGGVLANRLTEEKFTVLVIEAGKADPLASSILGLSTYLFNSDWNWGYKTVPQKHACWAAKEHKCYYPRGKSLGGSSVLNAGAYIRGYANDYDKWEELGNVGWSYRDCLPYFKKSEKAEFNFNTDKDYHGFDGPQSINIVEDTPNLTTKLIEAFKELGLDERDYNGQEPYGVSRIQYYLKYNIRSSTAQAFIRPAQNRTNLKISLQSLVTKIRISNGTARGVEFVKNGKQYVANAEREVIVSAGSINSPQVLMLSGIGPRRELRKHGIKVIANLPVGRNLHDHVVFSVTYRTNHVYYNNSLRENLELWKQAKRPLTEGGAAQIVSFWNLEGNNQPDVGIYAYRDSGAMATQFEFTDDYIEAYKTINNLTDISFLIPLFHPKSSGTVTLQSKDPRDFPLIDTNYFSDPTDLDTLYKGIQVVLLLNNTETFRKWQTRFLLVPLPNCDRKYERLSKDWWYCGLQSTSATIYHPIGTTRMGVSPLNSVVNSDLKVHGIKNLRVADAGVIPRHISGHTNAAVVMIAEKIADAIKAEHVDV